MSNHEVSGDDVVYAGNAIALALENCLIESDRPRDEASNLTDALCGIARELREIRYTLQASTLLQPEKPNRFDE